MYIPISMIQGTAMELGIRSNLNSFIGDNPERRLYKIWPHFYIHIFGGISLIFEKFILLFI